jgi:hypothetical protein
MALTNQIPAGTDYTSAQANQHSIPIVTSLPGDITINFTGKHVFNSTDNMLYRWDGSAWLAVAATGGSSAATMHECRYNQTTLQPIANATDTKLQFNTAETASNDVTASGVGNTDFLINRSGVWLFAAGTKYVAATANERHLWIMTGTVIGTTANRIAQQTMANVGTAPATLNCATVQRIAAATSICVGTFHNSGASVNTDVGFGKINHFSATWLRPL